MDGALEMMREGLDRFMDGAGEGRRRVVEGTFRSDCSGVERRRFCGFSKE